MTLEELLPLHDIPLRWHAGGALLAAAMLSIHCRARSTHIVAVCIIRLPGVVLHELAHLLCGILLRAEPAGFSLIPQCRGAGRWTLGSVTFRRVTAFNAVPIALAPLGLLPLAYLVWCYWFSLLPPSLVNTLLLYAAVCLLVGNALPSRQDLRVAGNWKSLLLYGSVGGLIGYLWFCCREISWLSP